MKYDRDGGMRYAVRACLVVLAVGWVGACGETSHQGEPPGNEAGQPTEPQAGAPGQGGSAEVPHGAAGASSGAGAGAGEAGAAQSGAGGTAGAGGELGQGGEGGETFQPPPPATIEVCGGGTVELDAELVRRAVVLSACLGGSTSNYLRYGLDGFVHHYTNDEIDMPWVAEDLQLEACPQTLLSCDDVWACLHERAVTTECEDAETRCDGALAINCEDGRPIQDCDALTGGKGECQVLSEGAGAHAECVLSDACSGGPQLRCEGDLVVACHPSGAKVGMDCAELGLTCRHGNCEPPTDEPATCTDVGEAACDGDRIRVCTLDGELYERDCSRLGGMTCREDSGDQPSDEPWFDCVADGCHAPFEWPDRCEGDDLMLALADGKRSPLHCADYGFATCANGRCVP